MNWLGTIFPYINLAFAIISAAAVLISLINNHALTGESLYLTISPVVRTLDDILPQVTIPNALVKKCCDAVAEVINTYQPPQQPPGPVLGSSPAPAQPIQPILPIGVPPRA